MVKISSKELPTTAISRPDPKRTAKLLKKTLRQVRVKSSTSTPKSTPSTAPMDAVAITPSPENELRPEHDQMAALIEENLALRTRLVAQEAAHAQEMARISATITASVTASLEETFSRRFEALKATIESLTHIPSPRVLTSYSDIAMQAPVTPPAPKRFKTAAAQKMDITFPKSRAQEIVDSVPASHARKCLRNSPAPKKGLQIVHIHGYHFGTGNPLNLFAALLEVKFKFPRRHILNVSPINHQLAEVVIEAGSLDSLRAALNVPGCNLRLSTTLDARNPVSADLSAQDARKFFDHRLNREITRLRSAQRSMFDHVANFLEMYKTDDIRFLA